MSGRPTCSATSAKTPITHVSSASLNWSGTNTFLRVTGENPPDRPNGTLAQRGMNPVVVAYASVRYAAFGLSWQGVAVLHHRRYRCHGGAPRNRAPSPSMKLGRLPPVRLARV